MNNIACRIFSEQIKLLLSLPNQEEAKTILYQAVTESYNQFENQNENQFDNQNANQFILYSVSDSISELSKSVLNILRKSIIWKEFSDNYGGYREGAGRKTKTPNNKKTPTKEEIMEYAKSRKREDLAEKFFDYYQETGWKDKDGKKVKNWKAKFITWENHNKPKPDAFELYTMLAKKSKIPDEVYIDSGSFYLDNTFDEFKDMTDDECNNCAKWLLDKFRCQTLPRDRFVKIVRGFKNGN